MVFNFTVSSGAEVQHQRLVLGSDRHAAAASLLVAGRARTSFLPGAAAAATKAPPHSQTAFLPLRFRDRAALLHHRQHPRGRGPDESGWHPRLLRRGRRAWDRVGAAGAPRRHFELEETQTEGVEALPATSAKSSANLAFVAAHTSLGTVLFSHCSLEMYRNAIPSFLFSFPSPIGQSF